MTVRAKRPAPTFATGATDAEVVRWAGSNDVFDRLADGSSEIVADHGDLDRLLEDAVLEGKGRSGKTTSRGIVLK